MKDAVGSRATCGHYDFIGYINSGPCMKCVRKIHKETIQGITTTVDKIRARLLCQ